MQITQTPRVLRNPSDSLDFPTQTNFQIWAYKFRVCSVSPYMVTFVIGMTTWPATSLTYAASSAFGISIYVSTDLVTACDRHTYFWLAESALGVQAFTRCLPQKFNQGFHKQRQKWRIIGEDSGELSFRDGQGVARQTDGCSLCPSQITGLVWRGPVPGFSGSTAVAGAQWKVAEFDSWAGCQWDHPCELLRDEDRGHEVNCWRLQRRYRNGFKMLKIRPELDMNGKHFEMAADDLVTQGAKASTTMIFT